MKFSDISNERTVLDEGVWDKISNWATDKYPEGSPEEKAMEKAVDENVKQMLKVARTAFKRGEDIEVQDLQDFFNGLGFGKSGAATMKQFQKKNIIQNNILPYDNLDKLLSDTVRKAIINDANAFVQKALPKIKIDRGTEAGVATQNNDDQERAEELRDKIIDGLGQEFRNIIDTSDDEEMKLMKHRAYRIFREVAKKYGKELPEASETSKEPAGPDVASTAE